VTRSVSQILERVAIVAEPRYATPRNADRRTLGPEVGRIMERLGTPPMPWQQSTLDVAYELDEEATEAASTAAGTFQPRLYYREPRLTVPRQSGKTQKALARHVDRHVNGPGRGWGRRPMTAYLAQTAMDSQDKMLEEWVPMLEDSDLIENVEQVIRSNGRASIRWNPPGGRIVTAPPSRKGGHGKTKMGMVDLDEAFAYLDGSAEQGLRPAMITAVCPQIWIVSTAGDATSVYLWGKVDDGRARCDTAEYGRVCYTEYSAAPGSDPSDPAVWAACMPALGHTISLEAIQAEFDSLPLDEFRRAYLNEWTTSAARIIPAAAWAACYAPESEPVGRLVISADASPSLTNPTATITVSGRNAAGKVHHEITGRLTPDGVVMDNRPGRDWVAARIGELTGSNRQVDRVLVDPTGPLGSILPDIREASYVNVELIDAQTMASACGRLHQDIMTGDVAHLGQAALDAAVDGAAKRTLLDRWAWTRRTSAEDISPLVAMTIGHWDVVSNPSGPLRMG
jgi:hypothetical protein